jgi:putative ABC transport system permease protein
MGGFLQDIRYGTRMLVRYPGFSAVAVLALALGIGANTAIFSVVNAVLLRPLPFSESDRLMNVWETNLQRGVNRGAVSYPNFADWREQNQVFEAMSSFYTSDFILTGGDEPARLQGAIVNADLFSILGEEPTLGRTFLPDEDKPGEGGGVVILSHRLWRQRFSADANVLGRGIVLNGKSYNVVGVMPEGFQFPIQNEPVELWATVAIDSTGNKPITSQRGAHYIGVIARLRPGVTKSSAQSEMDAIVGRLEDQYPDTNSHRGVYIEPALDSLVGDVRPALLILLSAVGCVLLIACANVANLLLTRATTRHKEMAIRAALGASRLRVVLQLLRESVMLSMLGGALGLLVARWGTDLLVAFGGDDIPRVKQIGIDGRVLGFTLMVSILTGLIFGFLPAIHSSKSDLTEALKEGGRSSTDGIKRNRVRGMLVIAEVAIAVVLLVGAGLLIQSLWRLQQVNPGFNPQNVLTLTLGLPEVKYPTERQAQFYSELLSRIETLPGVISASAVLPLPLSSDRVRTTFETEGRPMAKGDLPATEYRAAGLNYFRTMEIPLLRGRDFTARDDNKAPPVIIVNDAFARRFFPGEEVIGKHIKPGISTDEAPPALREIIGVVGNVKHLSLGAEPDPESYVPEAQLPFDSMAIVVRTKNDPRGILGAVQGEVRAMDKDLPVYNVKTLDEYLAASSAQPRFNTFLLAVFAGMALILTAVGLYGVMSYSVSQRTHEIGIRMALGAQQKDVLSIVVRQGMALTLAGVGAGLLGAYFITRLMSSLLFGISSTDPLTFIVISVLISLVALGACIVPARRATKVDPIVALRYE